MIGGHDWRAPSPYQMRIRAARAGEHAIHNELLVFIMDGVLIGVRGCWWLCGIINRLIFKWGTRTRRQCRTATWQSPSTTPASKTLGSQQRAATGPSPSVTAWMNASMRSGQLPSLRRPWILPSCSCPSAGTSAERAFAGIPAPCAYPCPHAAGLRQQLLPTDRGDLQPPREEGQI